MFAYRKYKKEPSHQKKIGVLLQGKTRGSLVSTYKDIAHAQLVENPENNRYVALLVNDNDICTRQGVTKNGFQNAAHVQKSYLKLLWGQIFPWTRLRSA